ncbi:MAG TPA: TAT-variant-translocated molybdopterin oxidoreductase [Pirellulales bacterium]|nr:TAT-variant-translocated molybdopterin oxidoreductase [Pirellulales bacterium]
MNPRKQLSPMFAKIQRKLRDTSGRSYWQCLEELADSEAFDEFVRQEFAALADIWPAGLSRRKFLGLLGASLALAGLGGCSVRPAPQGTIVPYAHPPEELLPGVPLFYATTMVHDGDAVGLLVETHEGRPTKIEGNPDHPASLGATDAFCQASILSLYDPLRLQAVMHGDRIRGWDDADTAMQAAMRDQTAKRGSGLRVLTGRVNSPTLGSQIDQLLEAFPSARWHQYEPVDRSGERQAAQIAFGQPVDIVCDFQAARVVLSLDHDFLTSGPGHVRYANDFMSARRVRSSAETAPNATMNRLYVVETEVTCTGAKADHRLAVRMRDLEQVAAAVASTLGLEVDAKIADEHAGWASAVARDLQAHAGECLVLAGHRQPAFVHLLAHAMNQQLGNVGRTLRYIKPVACRPTDEQRELRELVDDMQSRRVDVLLILGGDPAYNAPADVDFAAALDRVGTSFHLSHYENETSRRCTWHLPETHYLEAWSDARAFDGTTSIVQPLIAPLYQGRSAHEVIAALSGNRGAEGRELVYACWHAQSSARQEATSDERPATFDDQWQTVLHDGLFADSASSPLEVRLASDWQQRAAALRNATSPAAAGALEIAFQADPTIHDGRYANNGWLQELPKPITKLTWDNAALVSPRTAAELGVAYPHFEHGGEHGGYSVSMLRLQLGDRQVEAPAWIMPGHADGSITVYLGYGQQHAARAGGQWHSTEGFNAYRLRTSEAPWFASGLVVEKLDRTYPLACTQAHQTMAERAPIRAGTLEDYQQHPHEIAEQEEEPRGSIGKVGRPPRGSLYEPYDYSPPKHKWGMSIDTTACIGCNACVVACQAENNIPVVGKEQVSFGREMHWIRVDRYIKGAPESPEEFHFQPVPCMHCEHAPCEYVCPVAATVHSAEGLNEMVYNRCVGTRFCSNNCPYKVRRFNFLAFADFETVPLRMQYNPDVTVRSRGVMEKCTYCVQRIRQAEIHAEAAGRPLRDGDVVTACQAACPARAITFGDINDASSAVAQCKDSPLDYSLLAELNTFPRTTYMAALRNPNPELEGA